MIGTLTLKTLRPNLSIVHAIAETPEDSGDIAPDFFDPCFGFVPVCRVEGFVNDGFERVFFIELCPYPYLFVWEIGRVALAVSSPRKIAKNELPSLATDQNFQSVLPVTRRPYCIDEVQPERPDR